MGVWFIFAVAAIAAALADVVVEGLANDGAFGPASFTDGSNANIVPVACLGTVFLLRFLYLRVRPALHVGFWAAPTSRLARELPRIAVARRLPAVFVAQIAALWTMETIEQFAVVGHGFGGTVWMGGPVVLSLAVHAVLCIVTAFAARWVLRCLEPRALRLIRALHSVLGTVGDDRRPAPASYVAPIILPPCPVFCRIGVRGPPVTFL